MTAKQLAAFLPGGAAPHAVRIRALVRHGGNQTLSLHQTFAAHGFGWLAALPAPGVEVHLGMLPAERVAIPRSGQRTKDACARGVSDAVRRTDNHAAHDTRLRAPLRDMWAAAGWSPVLILTEFSGRT